MNPSDFLKTLSEIPSFRERMRFATKNLGRAIARGSGRAVYKFGPNSVLKLAMNRKGQSQNYAENDPVIQNSYGGYLVPRVLDADDEDRWIVSEKAVPITREEFEKLVGFDFDDVNKALLYLMGAHIDLTPEIKKILKDEWFNDLAGLVANMGLSLGDVDRIDHWGRIGNKPVLMDYGLTEYIFKEYY